MKTVLPLFIMVDARGWEIVRDDAFLAELAPKRKRLESVFGYSSACVPSILSGRWPAENGNWCYFVYDPEHSPFKSLRMLGWLPRALTSRRIARRWLTRLARKRLNFGGYFDLYNFPFDQIGKFDFSEKKSPLLPGGLNCGPNIFDLLEAEGIAYSRGDPFKPEKSNIEKLVADIGRGEIDFAFSYWPELDGLPHRVENRSPEIGARLRIYEQSIRRVVEAARGAYQELWLYVFSDQGMANCDELLDLRAHIDSLGLSLERDYAVVYDSTMARFWFHNQGARQKIARCGSVAGRA
jgi:hypothetical protein